MPLQATSGAASYDAFGGGVPVVPNYIEDVFSTWLYTGNGSTQTINNGIDLAGKGGLVWFKPRDTGNNHNLIDSARGLNKFLITNDTNAEGTTGSGFGVASFNSNGFSLNPPWTSSTNTTGTNYVSWTFRKQPKFFDVVTYTGDGVSGRTVSHNLGSAPGCMIVKRLDSATLWRVYHRSLGATQNLKLNDTAAAATESIIWNDTAPTSTEFTLGNNTNVNGNGSTYVAYLFAHNAGGFGLTGTDNVISCGSFTTDGNGTIPETSLGYEPQWVMFKAASTTGAWTINDTMRGQPTPATANASAPDATLYANNANAESQADNLYPTATGFKGVFAAVVPSTTYIYIAIRRGPMKVPTTGTSVFAPVAYTGTGAAGQVTGANFPPDLLWANSRNVGSNNPISVDRLRGNDAWLFRSSTAAETTITNVITSFGQNGIGVGTTATGPVNNSGQQNIFWMYRRAPGFFDEVCYTGNGVNGANITHNLTVAPEFVIMKKRSSSTNGEWTAAIRKNNGDYEEWFAGAGPDYAAFTTAPAGNTRSAASAAAVYTASYVKIGGSYLGTNDSGSTYVMYLFSTCAGVSKVGSYTGTGTTQTINCGFTGGARFVLIKRTDSTGDWYVWDTARGIVSGNDPYLRLNSPAAEVTSNDTIDTDSTGFVVNQVSATNVNVSSATYIFMAVA